MIVRFELGPTGRIDEACDGHLSHGFDVEQWRAEHGDGRFGVHQAGQIQGRLLGERLAAPRRSVA